MSDWRYYRRLISGGATLSRLLSELELERIRDAFLEGPFSSVLIAGGAKNLPGSERVLLEGLAGETDPFFVSVTKAGDLT